MKCEVWTKAGSSRPSVSTQGGEDQANSAGGAAGEGGCNPSLPAPIAAAAAARPKPLSVIPIWQLAWVWIHLSEKETLPTIDELNNCDTHWARFSNAPQQIYSAVTVNWHPSTFLLPWLTKLYTDAVTAIDAKMFKCFCPRLPFAVDFHLAFQNG